MGLQRSISVIDPYSKTPTGPFGRKCLPSLPSFYSFELSTDLPLADEGLPKVWPAECSVLDNNEYMVSVTDDLRIIHSCTALMRRLYVVEGYLWPIAKTNFIRKCTSFLALSEVLYGLSDSSGVCALEEVSGSFCRSGLLRSSMVPPLPVLFERRVGTLIRRWRCWGLWTAFNITGGLCGRAS